MVKSTEPAVEEGDEVKEVIDVSTVTGGLGRYQLMLVVMLFLRSFPSSWTLTGLEFIAGDIDHWCAPPPDTEWTTEEWKRVGLPLKSDGTINRCRRYQSIEGVVNTSAIEKCTQWTYNTSGLSSSVSEFDLVCERSWQKSAIQSIVFIAQIVGALLTGKMSDSYGRLLSCSISTMFFIVFGVAASFAPTIVVFNFLRFVQCICIAGLNTSISTLYAEVSHPKHRNLLNVGFALGFQIPMIIFPYFAKLLNNWRSVQLSMALSAAPLLPFFLFLQESPRWLLMKGNAKGARKRIEKILKFNGKTEHKLDLIMPMLVKKVRETQKTSNSAVDIWKYPSFRRSLLCLFALWFLDQVCFFSTIYLSTKIPGDRNTNFALSASAGVAGGLVSIVLLRFARRRISIASFLAIAALSSFVEAFVPANIIWAHLATSMVSRFSIVICTGILWAYSLEVLPTSVRNLGFSCCFCFGRVAGTISPFMRDLSNWNASSPHLVLSGTSALAILTLIYLPETLNITLPDSMQESDRLGKENSSAAAKTCELIEVEK